MDISVHTVCFNEERMLPHFLNYYGRVASRIFVYDNRSTDRTVEIAQAHPKAQVFSFDTGDALSERSLMYIRNTCWKRDESDYSIVCDTDEFLYCEDLRSFLSARPQYQVFRPAGFDMVADEFPADYTRLITEQVKLGCPSAGYSKMVLFRPRALHEMNFGPGSHVAAPLGREPLEIYDAQAHGGDLKLLHCKNMGFDYRWQRHRMLSPRLKGEEFEKYRFGLHYAFDATKQREEYDQLASRATRVVG